MEDLNNENIIHVKRPGMEYIQFKRLLKYKDVVKHAIYFKPLDFKPKNLTEQELEDNYKAVCDDLGININTIVKKLQTHTNNVAIVTKENMKEFFNEIDGLITNEKNIALPIVTADCIPLLFFDPEKKVIANVHSGWRGTAQRIAEIAVKKMIDNYNCNSSDIICCIGPAINRCHFEVQQDVKDIFEKEFNDMLDKGIITTNKEKENSFFIDNSLINRLMLLDLGLKDENIIDSNICTVCNYEKLHSYRRENGTSGLNLIIISLV